MGCCQATRQDRSLSPKDKNKPPGDNVFSLYTAEQREKIEKEIEEFFKLKKTKNRDDLMKNKDDSREIFKEDANIENYEINKVKSIKKLTSDSKNKLNKTENLKNPMPDEQLNSISNTIDSNDLYQNIACNTSRNFYDDNNSKNNIKILKFEKQKNTKSIDEITKFNKLVEDKRNNLVKKIKNSSKKDDNIVKKNSLIKNYSLNDSKKKDYKNLIKSAVKEVNSSDANKNESSIGKNPKKDEYFHNSIKKEKNIEYKLHTKLDQLLSSSVIKDNVKNKEIESLNLKVVQIENNNISNILAIQPDKCSLNNNNPVIPEELAENELSKIESQNINHEENEEIDCKKISETKPCIIDSFENIIQIKQEESKEKLPNSFPIIFEAEKNTNNISESQITDLSPIIVENSEIHIDRSNNELEKLQIMEEKRKKLYSKLGYDTLHEEESNRTISKRHRNSELEVCKNVNIKKLAKLLEKNLTGTAVDEEKIIGENHKNHNYQSEDTNNKEIEIDEFIKHNTNKNLKKKPQLKRFSLV